MVTSEYHGLGILYTCEDNDVLISGFILLTRPTTLRYFHHEVKIRFGDGMPEYRHSFWKSCMGRGELILFVKRVLQLGRDRQSSWR